MLVHFEHLPAGGRSFAWQIAEPDGDAECGFAAPLEAQCHVQPTGPDSVEINGQLSGTVILVCDRCLSSYPFKLVSPFRIKALVRDAEQDGPPLDTSVLVENELDDLNVIELDSPSVDLGGLMREQLLLTLPEKKLCRQDCAGLCPQCGTRLDEEVCTCQKKTGHPAFAALAALVGRKTEEDKTDRN